MKRSFLPCLGTLLALSFVAGCSDSTGTGGSGAGNGGGAAGEPSGGGGSEAQGGTAAEGGASTGGASNGGANSGGSGGGGIVGDVCTSFDLDENPISGGGIWQEQGGLSGLDWTNVQSQGGIAFGTLTGFGGYNDSIALLGGFSPDYRLSAVIHFDGTRDESTSSHEVELILRGSYDPHVQHLYECNLGYSGPEGWYAQVFVLDGTIGTFVDIGQGVNAVPEVQDGDVFRAEIVGNVIHTYLNDLELVTATDDTLPSGQPGIGFFWRGTENASDFGFDSVCATQL